MSVDKEVFRGKTIADVFKDVYTHTDSKREQINVYVTKLVQMIKTPEEAAVISPIIKEFLEVAVKNDEQLVKVAQIAQRIYATSAKVASDSGVLSDREKEQLLSTLNKDMNNLREAAEKLTDVEKVEAHLDELEDELDFMRTG